MKITDIKPNPDNPRLIKDDKFKKLCKSISEFPQMMELRPIVVDADGVILGGNMRYQALKHNGTKDIPDEWVRRAEDLTEEEKKRFIITDNSSFGEYDWDMIANEWGDLPLGDWGLDVPRLAGLDDDKYTTKIKTPIYEIKGEKPSLSDLCDTRKAMDLIGKIKSAALPKDVEDFLINAAHRHNIFNYEKIAEYYAHCDEDMQELFEESALVIIDFDKAVENGFVRLANEIVSLSGESDDV